MNLRVTASRTLDGVPSASGIEAIAGLLYVVSDDSPWLYVLDGRGERRRTERLTEQREAPGERIAKFEKPDLECLTAVPTARGPALLALGSGSLAPQRETAILISLSERGAIVGIERRVLSELYARLRDERAVTGGAELNLEGAAVAGDELLLFQRGNFAASNAVLRFSADAFCRYIAGGDVPSFEVAQVVLPPIDGISSGFSGACALDATTVLFTATAEDTSDAISDGRTVGCMIGRIASTSGEIRLESAVRPHVEGGRAVKLESITVLDRRKGIVRLAAVSDDDNGGSELFFLEWDGC